MRKKLLITVLVLLVIGLVGVIAARVVLFRQVRVPTAAMANTIIPGDHVFVRKLFGEIRRGDVVMFISPREPSVYYVKRVIGLPGETVEVRGLRVYINNQPMPEHTIVAANINDKGPLRVIEDPPRNPDELWDVYYFPVTVEAARRGELGTSPDFHFGVNGQPFKVPENSYFVMGDNRDNSLDSRMWGTVPRESIWGKATTVYWSDGGDESNPEARWERIGKNVK